MHHTVIIILIFTSVLIGTFNYSKFRESKVRFFLFFLWYVFISELLVYFLQKQEINTNMIYNVYSMVSFSFYFILFHSVFKEKTKRNIIKGFLFSLWVFAFTNSLFFQKQSLEFQSNTIFFGIILLIPTIAMFYVEMLNKNILFNIKKVLIFWISIGLLLFYVGIFPIIIARNFFRFNDAFNNITLALNFIMYGSFIIGFLKTKKQYNY